MRLRYLILTAVIGILIYSYYDNFYIMFIIILLVIIGIIRSLRIRRNSISVSAEVTEIKRSTGRHKYDNVFVSFYDENGQQIIARMDEHLNEFKVGDTINIVYMRNKPTNVYRIR